MTIDCKIVEEKIIDYMSGDIAGAPADEIASHLQKCEKCRKEAILLRKTMATLRNACSTESPPPVLSKERLMVLEAARDEWILTHAPAGFSMEELTSRVETKPGTPEDLSTEEEAVEKQPAAPPLPQSRSTVRPALDPDITPVFLSRQGKLDLTRSTMKIKLPLQSSFFARFKASWFKPMALSMSCACIALLAVYVDDFSFVYKKESVLKQEVQVAKAVRNNSAFTPPPSIAMAPQSSAGKVSGEINARILKELSVTEEAIADDDEANADYDEANANLDYANANLDYAIADAEEADKSFGRRTDAEGLNSFVLEKKKIAKDRTGGSSLKRMRSAIATVAPVLITSPFDSGQFISANDNGLLQFNAAEDINSVHIDFDDVPLATRQKILTYYATGLIKSGDSIELELKRKIRTILKKEADKLLPLIETEKERHEFATIIEKACN